MTNPKVRLRVGHQHRSLGRFWPISWIITHCFGVPERFPRLTNPGVCLCFGHHHSRFWLILSRFVDYYSPFLGPKQISIVVEPQGAITCRPSTLTVLADSGVFRGLLLTDLGSRSDSHSCRTPRCAYVSIINTRSFDQFRPVSWTITHRFGVLQRFP